MRRPSLRLRAYRLIRCDDRLYLIQAQHATSQTTQTGYTTTGYRQKETSYGQAIRESGSKAMDPLI
jgi:hypothetical protein